EALLVQTDAFAVYEAVKALLEASQADYAYVDKTVEVDGEPGWEIVADAARRSAGYGSAWKKGLYSSVPSSHQPLAAGRAVVVHTEDLKGDERALYEDDGIYSEATVPIFISGEFRGSIGFTLYTDDGRWSDAEIQTLWRASHMISAYWRRQEDAEELRESNESKERLLASVSHEIRTPLTAIVGLSEEILSSRTSLGDEELDELNGIIAIQSRELAELVEDLLVASRADGGTLSIRPDVVDLRDQAEKVLQGVQESHPTDKEIILRGEGVVAWADPLRVRQVIRNLLTNAIKYGGGQIVLGVSENEGRAQVMVADDGVGVPVLESDLIFERYYRSAQSPTQPGSVGIGLAVSRQLADMMDGTLEYINGENQHRFVLSLPGAEPVDAGSASAHEGITTNT
ncbi:MAG: sensor histidine kinase, partial [Acidimicrobiia bacterium]